VAGKRKEYNRGLVIYKVFVRPRLEYTVKLSQLTFRETLTAYKDGESVTDINIQSKT